MLAALALVGTLTASSASATDRTTNDRASFPYGESATRVEITDESTAARPSIEGQVAVIEHHSGRMILDTEQGPLSVVAAPDELRDLEVGDTVRVSLIVNSRD
jgi:hypothetical protein